MRIPSYYISIVFLVVAMVAGLPARILAQQENQVRAAFQEYSGMMVEEKLFAHTDRELYLPGETVWMKIYYVDGKNHQPFNLSKVVYAELIGKDQNPVARAAIEMEKGGAEGYLQLPASLSSGEYMLRVYTSWMKNFDPALYFNRKLSIVDPNSATSPFVEKENRVIADLFPEGGQLVEGFNSRVAFLVADQQGRGSDAVGMVLNSRNDTITTFRTRKFGMGVFEIKPRAGEKYEVRIISSIPDTAAMADFGDSKVDDPAITLTIPLEVKNSGYALRLDEQGTDNLRLTTFSSLQSESMLVVIHSRQQISHAFLVPPADGERTFEIDKSALGEGVSHITVFNSRNEAVAERLYCKLPARKLDIRLSPSTATVKTRTEFRVGIDVTDPGSGNNNPIHSGSTDLSVSVFQADPELPVEVEGLQEYLFLRSELGGTIENPSYYFQGRDPDRLLLLDNLMLTRGWRKFDWKKVLADTINTPASLPEPEGRLLKATGAGKVQNFTGIISFPGTVHALAAGVPDSSGAIYFSIPPVYGRKLLVGELYKDGIIHPGFQLESPYSEEYPLFPLSRTVQVQPRLAESAFLNYQVGTRFGYQQVSKLSGNDSTVIGGQGADTGRLFFGRADRTYMLDDYTRFETMEDVLREYVGEVLVQKRRDTYRFDLVKRNEDGTAEILNPAIFLDGVPVTEKIILDLDPLRVRKLDIVRSRYFFGQAIFDGILSFSTYEGKTAAIELDPAMLIIDFEGLQSRRQFVAPAYPTEAERLTRIPDFRTTLYWNPSLKTTTHTEARFFTSDTRGKFIILVHGLHENGIAGTAWYSFEVK